ncbi:MAG: SDR family oxidoreductase [Caldisericaceae bacterium]
MENNVVLVTGASSGIGKACAEKLAKDGFTVYGASRSYEDLDNNPHFIRIDVTEEESLRKGVEYIIEREGKIDSLINAAGFGISGAIEDTPFDQIYSQLETNFFGTVRTIKEILPFMRAKEKGTIINISSIGGIVGLPFQAFYSASKFAIEGFSEAMRMEVEPFHINVVVIEPGDFRTGFTSKRVKCTDVNSPYAKRFADCIAVMEKDELNGEDPELIADLVLGILKSPSPSKPKYIVGPFGEKLFVFAKRYLPYGISNYIFKKYYRL